MCKCSGASRSHSRAASSASRATTSAVFFQALTGQVAALQAGELASQLLADRSDQRRVPGDQHARTGTVLGLRDQVAGDIRRLSGFVRQNHDLARARDAVDIDLAVDESLGQRDEEVARPNDLVDTLNSLNAIGQRRDPLRAPIR